MRSLLIFLICMIVCGAKVFAASYVYTLKVTGPITPPVEAYIQSGLTAAVKDKAILLIIKLDTPGGLESTIRGINKSILASPIPVVTYITPSGGRVARAGAFILYASHIAAMAPKTHVEIASPVNLNFSTSEKKAQNDTIAYIQSLATLRHRNATWTKLAALDRSNLDAEEALQQKVIDLVAANVPELINKIQGRTITLLKSPTTINFSNPIIKEYPPDWRIQLLSIVTNPSIAYILMLVGLYGLFFELMNPGLILPGVIGIITLLIALYAFQLLPVSYTGLTLLLLGLAGMLSEAFITSFGILGIGGVIAFIIGSMMLFDSSVPGFQLAWSIILIMSAISIIFAIFVAWIAIKALKKPIVTGREALIHMTGEVVNAISPNHFSVRVNGELWQAYCDQPLALEQRIKVVEIQNLILKVKPIAE